MNEEESLSDKRNGMIHKAMKSDSSTGIEDARSSMLIRENTPNDLEPQRAQTVNEMQAIDKDKDNGETAVKSE